MKYSILDDDKNDSKVDDYSWKSQYAEYDGEYDERCVVCTIIDVSISHKLAANIHFLSSICHKASNESFVFRSAVMSNNAL